MLRKTKQYIMGLLGLKNSKFEKILNKQLIILGQAQSKVNKDLAQVDDLSEVEFSIFSQWGEDGIIDWLVSKLPTVPSTFVEFGVENYQEANTRLLIQMQNWQGLIIDGSAENIRDIKRQDISWRHQLHSLNKFITRENIDQLIVDAGFQGEIGLLSIDIDGNDYWVWQAITSVSPAIVVCEYNAVFGDLHPVTVPYRDDFHRTKAHYSNLYFGASLPALIFLAREKGYTFVGTCAAGVNAFFVPDDIVFDIRKIIRNVSAYPSKFREARDPRGKLLFLGGVNRSELICDCPLINVVTGDLITIRELGSIYGQEWIVGERRIF